MALRSSTSKKEQRVEKVNDLARKMHEMYDGELEAITIAFISNDNDALKTLSHNYKVLDGQLKLVEK